MSDFTYNTGRDGYTMVMPETTNAAAIWEANPLLHSRLTPFEFRAFRAQARLAGYSVRKAAPVKATTLADDLRLLESLGEVA